MFTGIVGHVEWIRLEEAAQLRVVVAGVVVVEAGGRVLALAGELLGDVGRAFVAAEAAEGRLLVEFDDRPGGVGDEVRAVEVIRMVEVERGRAGGFGDGDCEPRCQGMKGLAHPLRQAAQSSRYQRTTAEVKTSSISRSSAVISSY